MTMAWVANLAFDKAQRNGRGASMGTSWIEVLLTKGGTPSWAAISPAKSAQVVHPELTQ